MIKCLIIENEIKASEFLQNTIGALESKFQIISVATTIKESISLIKKVSPDIIFLDIELDDGLGFEILEYFTELSFEVIFITAFNSYYQRAFEHFAFSYILKPFQPIDLKRVLDHYIKKNKSSEAYIPSIQEFFKKDNPRVLVYNGREHISILINNIMYCRADGNHTQIITSNINSSKILVNHNLGYFSDLLSPKGFFRASRFCLLNIAHIKSIYKKDYITLSNNEKIKVSTRNKDHLAQLIEALKR